jgi:NAD(P)-dependent dehydrogenase (short-subunit alcohol dehydrogenase family)
MASSGATSGVVALVTGASRGAGKGIALALGQTGATVYVTGRSARGDDSPYGGTVGETAALIDEAGGTGVPVLLDHADDAGVAALSERIAGEHGRLDILVNNAAKAGTVQPGGFWNNPLDLVDLITVGLRSHYVAAYHAAPLLIANGRGLIVNTGYYGAVSYHQGPSYGAQKAGADKMAADMAKELRPHNVAAVSIWMGHLSTERANVVRAAMPAEKRVSVPLESTQFTGRVIAALYAHDDLMSYSGRTLIGAELGAQFGITDVDGTVPVSLRYELGGPPELHHTLR